MANPENGYPLINYNFMLRVEGMFDLPCKSVHGFQEQKEYEYIREGGVNDYVHIRRKPASGPKTFQVERYAGQNMTDPLSLGNRLVLPVQLLVSSYPGEFELPKRIYTFMGCVVIAKEYGELTAENAGILTETVTIAYNEMICVDNPTEVKKEMWKFEGTKPEGNGVRFARKVQDYGIGKRPEQETRRSWPNKKSAKNIKNYLQQ